MTAKEFLQQAFFFQREIEINLERISRLQSLATRTTTVIKGTPGGKSLADNSRVENSVVMIQEQIDRLAEEISLMLEVIKKISVAISSVSNNNEQAILKYRYLCFFSWETIAEIMQASDRKVFALHQQALKKISACMQ